MISILHPLTESKKQKIAESIKNAWLFLVENQQRNGKFAGIAFADSVAGAPAKEASSPTPFTTSVILSSLRNLNGSDFVDQEQLAALASKAANYLLSQKDETLFAWNYWETGNDKRRTLPPDMDDTALAVASLQLWQPESLDGEALANLVHALLMAEISAGGPYNTWLNDFKKHDVWADCDIGVNANIAFMSSLLGITLKNLNQYFEEAVLSGKLSSAYYLSPLVLLYFISRGYGGDKKELFVEAIEKERIADGTWGSPMHTALALSSLHNFGKNITGENEAIDYIVEAQQSGRWEKEIFYLERRNPEDRWYHGSESISTALCIEALSLLLVSAKKEIKPSQTAQTEPKHFQAEADSIAEEFANRASAISEEYKILAEKWIAKMFAHDWIRDSILFPFFLNHNLISTQANTEKEVAQQELSALSLANLFGWIGYTIMDDIMDEDAPASMIPFANFCLREMNMLFAENLSAENMRTAKELLNEIDKAYSFEQSQRAKATKDAFRIPFPPQDNQQTEFQLMPKSIGIAIGGLSLFNNSEALINFFRYFLRAKQNSDDAEDLIDDLARGHITPAASRVLAAFRAKYPRREMYSISVDRDLLLSIFWNETYPLLFQEMNEDLSKAAIAIAELPLREDNYFMRLTNKLQTAIRRTNDERRKVQDFLSEY
ncbi:MAG: hypothetical protein KA028_00550 [Candidatus Pacebacteria bacterium]|nr:hypothetical protein [Candidatus Paceibacterota bacterium]MBP9851693.1 hypothetical protein [Candidatus Paceibacterota bacterium]